MSVTDILAPWATVDAALGLSGPIRDEAHYEALLAFVDECFDRFGAEEHHPVFALVDLVADRIREYEGRVHPWPDTLSSTGMLAYLMEEHGLKQSDLPEVGTQSVISDLLTGKRRLNLRQVRALASRFHVPMEIFAEAAAPK
ncbi:MAG: helix-turn-helix domain-containing protein [Candidatus Accumulibacter sp. UW25]|jgi:HTH-type transcriptional regulator/antitoxin HigA